MADCYDVAIIGGGVTGFSAAMYAGRFELKTIVFAETRGGTIVLSPAVENFPGFENIVGFDLAEKIMNQAVKFGAEVKDERVEKVERKEDGQFALTTKRGEYCAKTVIFATGTTWKKMGVPGEEKFTGRGVHYCALCDGAFYKGKVIGVVGGGDSAVKESVLLSSYGSKVYLFVRKDALRAEPVNCRRLEAEKKIEMIAKVNVKEVKGGAFPSGKAPLSASGQKEGGEKVTHVLLDREVNGSRELKLDAVFVAIGHEPLSGLAKSLGAKLNAECEIVVNRDMETGVPGVFAAGDVVDSKFKQAITGAGEGVTAVHSAYTYLSKHEAKR